jgi:hypothetical protein
MGTASGEVQKISPSGEVLERFSPIGKTPVADLEAAMTVKIFAFYQEAQQFAFFNQFLGQQEIFSLQKDGIGFIEAAGFASDGALWLLDGSSFSLKKYLYQQEIILLEFPLYPALPATNSRFVWLREYQNRIYLHDETNGTHVFDFRGSLLHTLPGTKGMTSLGFSGPWLYGIVQGTAWMVPLYGGKPERLVFPEIDRLQRIALLKDGSLLLATDPKQGKLFLKQ